MAYNIPEILASRKTADAVLVVAIVLLGLVSFGLGRLSAEPRSSSGVALCEELPPGIVMTTTQQAAVIGSDSPMEAGAVQKDAVYVGSRNGSVFHFPWCSGAQRIKEENKVWFTTKEEAGAAGYRPASNCKGL